MGGCTCGILKSVEIELTGKPMTKVEAVLQPSRLEAVKNILVDLGVEGMTISDARGHGRQKGHTEHYRGREYAIDLLPKIKLEIVVPDDRVEITVNAIMTGAATGKIGDEIGRASCRERV